MENYGAQRHAVFLSGIHIYAFIFNYLTVRIGVPNTLASTWLFFWVYRTFDRLKSMT